LHIVTRPVDALKSVYTIALIETESTPVATGNADCRGGDCTRLIFNNLNASFIGMEIAVERGSALLSEQPDEKADP